MTILFQYYRLLATSQTRKLYIAAIAIVGAWSVSQVLIATFTCSPISGFWDKTITSTCIPNYPFWYINAGGHIMSDVAVFLMPLPSLSRLKLPKQQKLVLIGIFCLGFL